MAGMMGMLDDRCHLYDVGSDTQKRDCAIVPILSCMISSHGDRKYCWLRRKLESISHVSAVTLAAQLSPDPQFLIAVLKNLNRSTADGFHKTKLTDMFCFFYQQWYKECAVKGSVKTIQTIVLLSQHGIIMFVSVIK